MAGIAVLIAACGVPGHVSRQLASAESPDSVSTVFFEPVTGGNGTIRMVFAGDVMLGRRVTAVAEREGPELFEQIRHIVSSADLSMANLESPATSAPHVSENPNDLRSPPELVRLLAGAGFDAVSVANNHSGDTGILGFEDTLAALDDAGLAAIGTARQGGTALPIRQTLNGITISMLGYDATRLGIEPNDGHLGTALLNLDLATAQVAEETLTADLVVVSLHGGIEYLLDRDPILSSAAAAMIEAGADIVWGHGPHVVQPIAAHRNSVVATSLGNLLFDQAEPSTQHGLLLEVLASADGPLAYRMIDTSHADLRVHLEGLGQPEGDAVLIDGAWWALTRPPLLAPPALADASGFPWGTVTAARIGPITQPGMESVVVSYRHPFRETQVNHLYPEHGFIDETGMSAHMGVFQPDSYEPVWAAGTLLRPVADLAVCDGSLALAFNTLDDPAIVATSAWTWHGFGFRTAPELLGSGSPGCADLDGDGQLDPVITAR